MQQRPLASPLGSVRLSSVRRSISAQQLGVGARRTPRSAGLVSSRSSSWRSAPATRAAPPHARSKLTRVDAGRARDADDRRAGRNVDRRPPRWRRSWRAAPTVIGPISFAPVPMLTCGRTVGPVTSPARSPMVTNGEITTPAADLDEPVGHDAAVDDVHPGLTTTGSPIETCALEHRQPVQEPRQHRHAERLQPCLGAVQHLREERVADPGQPQRSGRAASRPRAELVALAAVQRGYPGVLAHRRPRRVGAARAGAARRPLAHASVAACSSAVLPTAQLR